MATLNSVNSVSLNQTEMKQLTTDLNNYSSGFTGFTGRVTPMGNKEDLARAVERNTRRLNK